MRSSGATHDDPPKCARYCPTAVASSGMASLTKLPFPSRLARIEIIKSVASAAVSTSSVTSAVAVDSECD